MIYRLLPADVADEQALWLLIGLGAFMVTLLLVRDDRVLDGFTYTIGLLGLCLLLLPIVPGIGVGRNGARLWADIGPIEFQPAEFGRILIVIFLASYLSAKRELLEAGVGRLGLPRAKDLGPLLLAWGASLAVLFLERDLGASMLFFGIFVVMLWVATGRAAYLVLGVLLFAIGATFGYYAFDHVQDRVTVWLNVFDPRLIRDEGFQLAQSLFAMATGGIAGTGLGEGQPGFIPDAHTDFVFAAVGEELGLLGTIALLLLYVLLIFRGYRAAVGSPDGFGQLLAAGLSTILALQTFVIIGGVTRLIPLTGITLPFVSYGGSSLVANMVLLALLVRVSSGAVGRPAEDADSTMFVRAARERGG
jgi:cell division protein FtsW (lipid II flippase)